MDGYISEIRVVAFDFIPNDWLPCDGRLLEIKEYQALYSLIETTYGGNKNMGTFALPDLRGRTPLCLGDFSPLGIAEYGGFEDVQLTEDTMPAHSHRVVCSTEVGNQQSGKDAFFAQSKANNYTNTEPKSESLVKNNSMVSQRGGNVSHNNIQPSIGLNFLICFNGIYPRRG